MKNTTKLTAISLSAALAAGIFTGCANNAYETRNSLGGADYAQAPQDTQVSYAGTDSADWDGYVQAYPLGEAEAGYERNAAPADYTDSVYSENPEIIPPSAPDVNGPGFFPNTEEYNVILENGFTSVNEQPLSTFSIDVDTASYSNIRRMIQDGYIINPDAVRVEEMINYFNYDYKNPRGGPDPFSINLELSDCPWNSRSQLALIGLQAEKADLQDRVPMNLVFLIDVSGSMDSPDKLPLVQRSFEMLCEELDEKDRISIVTYSGAEKVVLEGEEGDNYRSLMRAINSLSAGGSTAGEAGITMAYKIAEEYFIEGGNNRIILATDGDLNVGISSEEELIRLIEEKRETGVFLTVLGYGTGNIKDNKLQALADNGNGMYAYIDSEREAHKVLVEDMGGTLIAVAKDVKIQVEFNPANILGYRLIGYENRALDDRDFSDDTKDAGEIGAGHTVTALYELVLVDDPYAPVLKYADDPEAETQTQAEESFSDELLTVSVRYKEPDEDVSKLLSIALNGSDHNPQLSGNIAFAAAVTEFGMLLKNSEYKGTSSYDGILALLSDYNFSDDEYKREFADLVRMVK